MRDRYDIIVVGGGPSGSMAARSAAESGASVLLLEKDREIGIPVRCAEGVGELGLKSVVDVDPKWITKEIIGATFYSPSGHVVRIKTDEVGYVLNRKLFDYDLAQRAAAKGAEIITRAYVHDLLHEDGYVSGVRVKHLGKEYSIKAKVVIGADGVESRVGRWAGLKTKTSMRDMETCAQFTAANIDLDDNYCHFYFSRRIAPGGYLWVFPKGNGMANVGLGISGEFAAVRSPYDYLNEFFQQHFPQAAILTTVVGGVPCAPPLQEMVADGLMLVGDAAHQANPVSGGGIVTGMLAGKIAGQVAAEAIAKGDTGKNQLKKYVKQWLKAGGQKNKLFYNIKKYVYNLTDEDLDQLAEILNDMPEEKRTILTLFKKALVKKPSLIMDAIKVFT